MIRPALLLACAVIGAPLAAQSATGRWSLQLRGPVAVERGDLRIDGDSGRLLLESRDTLWLAVRVSVGDGGRVHLVVADGLRLEGSLGDDVMEGVLRGGEGTPGSWVARRIQPATERWPVRPRVVVRQLVIGRDDSVAVFSDAWRGRTLSAPALLAEHATLAHEVGFPAGDLGSIAARAQSIVLGLDPVGRDMARRQLERVAASPAADVEFMGLFRGPGGDWRLDLHDAAWQFAAAEAAAALATDSLVPFLRRVGMAVSPEAGHLEVVRAVWQLWSRLRNDPGLHEALLARAAVVTEPGQRGVLALLNGYDLASAWWLRAVDWLLRHRWLAVDATWHSPVDLVRAFWERDTLELPDIEPGHFGSMQAVPVIGSARLGRLLLRPANAVAAEFLDTPAGRREAMAAWRGIDFREVTPLRVTVGPQAMTLGSPASQTRSRLGGFLSAESAIRIEPGIMPIFAVGTVVHEWQHLLFETSRMEGEPAPAIRAAEWGVRLVEADPWLAEGAAEWAAEQVLAPVRASTPLFALIEAEKRLSIGSGNPDDTHVLGYLLVRAAMHRVERPTDQRRLLVAMLHDPVALADAIGLAGRATQRIPRPTTLVIIPEIMFSVDGGVADDATRRLIIPVMPVEP